MLKEQGRLRTVWLCAFALINGVAIASTQNVTFEFEDDGVTPLVNGQDISTPPEFGNLFNVSSTGNNLGPAIFDTDSGGPNAGGPDPDLLVDSGNCMILQSNSSPSQTIPGIFDTPNDSAQGGTITFDFQAAGFHVRVISIDIIDRDANGRTSVILEDDAGLFRTVDIPANWTGEPPGDPGIGTIDLETGNPTESPNISGLFTSVTTNPGFDIDAVVELRVLFTGSGGIDNLVFDDGVGACCNLLDETCDEFVLEEECTSAGLRYGGDQSDCSTIDPPCACDEVCEACTVKTGAGTREIEIGLVSAVYDGTNTTFTYRVCQDPASQDLSHWVLGLTPDCCSRLVSSTGQGATSSCETDPTTGLFGLKWETNSVSDCDGVDCSTGGDLFSVTLIGNVPTGCVKTSNKINGPPAEFYGCVQGPDCTPECVVDADCSDGIDCTVDTCDVGLGICVHTAEDSLCSNGDFCDGNETCDPVSGCVGGTPPDCDDGVSCTVDTCDEVNDTCVNTPNDALCSNGQFCDGDETCDPVNGCQAGTPVDCNDNVGCTVDSCNESTDMCVNAPDNALCSDGNPCNGVETCDAMNDCQAGTPPNCDDGVSCTIDACDPQTGQCTHTPDDSVCNNGQFCDGVETCDPINGCQAGTPPNCNDNVGCTVDTCDEANDQCVNTPDNALCDDTQFCNGVETCDPVNDCQAGTPPNCDDGVGCTADTCDEANDQCVNTPDNSVCNNFIFCDGLEFCDPVNDCQPGTPPDCSDDEPCTDDSCNEKEGCVNTPNNTNCDDGVSCTVDVCDKFAGCINTPDDSLCNNGQFCDGVEVCDPIGDCQPGTPPDCDDSVACTVDECDEVNDQCVSTPDNANCDDSVACTVDVCDPVTGCSNTPDDASCSNGLFCDGTEICDPVNDCQDGPDPCDASLRCDEDNNACVDCLTNGQCDDGLFCNGQETCVNNVCVPGVPPDCDDGVSCTVDDCDEQNDTCTNTPDDSICNNGLFCDGVETCDPVNDCQPGTPPDCDDGVVCTVDDCDEANDTCTNTPDDSICNNGLFCDGVETCDPVNDCQPGTPPNCDDGVVCTVDDCDEANDTCTNTPDDASCSDGDPCTGIEICDPTNDCQPGTPPDCSDNISCTNDACDPNTGSCVNAPDDSLCNDNVFCNGEETCDPLNDCQAGPPPDCDDGVSCTVDECDAGTDQCVNTADDSLCNNGQFCDGEETCDPVNDCQDGTDPDCDDGVVCTVDTCDENTDSCVNTPNNAQCNDNDPCTVDTCTPNGCTNLDFCGACCFEDGTCNDGVTSSQCTSNGGSFFGVGSECAGDGDNNGTDDLCDPGEPVPTTSHWGLLVLALLLLIVGKTYGFRRWQSV